MRSNLSYLLKSFLLYYKRHLGSILHTVDFYNYLSPDKPHTEKMLVMVNGNRFKIHTQQHNNTSSVVSVNSLIAKFIRYHASRL